MGLLIYYLFLGFLFWKLEGYMRRHPIKEEDNVQV